MVNYNGQSRAELILIRKNPSCCVNILKECKTAHLEQLKKSFYQMQKILAELNLNENFEQLQIYVIPKEKKQIGDN